MSKRFASRASFSDVRWMSRPSSAAACVNRVRAASARPPSLLLLAGLPGVSAASGTCISRATAAAIAANSAVRSRKSVIALGKKKKESVSRGVSLLRVICP